MEKKFVWREANISGIQFGLIDDEKIEQIASFTLSKNPVTSKRGVPVLDSSTDARLGSVSSSIACSTCSQNSIVDQGHWGRFELRFPCLSGTWLPWAHMVLTCFCWQCSRLLIPESNNKLKSFRKMDVVNEIGFDHAIRELYAQALKAPRICGGPNTSSSKPLNVSKRAKQHASTGCHAINPLYWIRQAEVLVRPVFEGSNPPVVTPYHMWSVFQNISDKDCMLFGIQPPLSRMSAFCTKWMLLSPMLIRSSRSRRSVDDLTLRTEDIVRYNRTLFNNEQTQSNNLSLCTEGTDEFHAFGSVYFEASYEKCRYDKSDRVKRIVSKQSVVKQPMVPKQLSNYFELQRQVAAFICARLNPKGELDYGRVRTSVMDKFSASANGENRGLIRGNLMGKRGDQTARSPVSPDTYINFDFIGVPIRICSINTKKEVVSKQNYGRLLALVLRGNQYPGANRLTRDGVDYELPGFAGSLKIGDTVHRHLQKGDWVLFNRQPTLHRYSMMAVRVWPMSQGQSFRVSELLTTPYAMDFDGDEMNLLVLPDDMSSAEALTLMAVGENMFRNGELIIQLVQHAVIGARMLTAPHYVVDKAMGWQMAMSSDIPGAIEHVQQVSSWPISGARYLQVLTTPMFYDGHTQVDKSSINAIMANMIRWFGDGVGILSGFNRLFEHITERSGISLSFYDCYVPKPPALKERVKEIQRKVEIIEQENRNISGDCELSNSVEKRIMLLLDAARDAVGAYIREQFQNRGTNRHPIIDIIESKAKGDSTHVLQLAGILGLLRTHSCQRFPVMTPHECDDIATARGFLTGCFSEGLGPIQFYLQTTGARGGLIDSVCMIQRSGYLFRRMCKALEDCIVAFDNSIRTQSGLFILPSFGFDTTYLKSVVLETLDMTPEAIQSKFFVPYGQLAQREIDAMQMTRCRILSTKNVDRQISLPIQWSMLSHVPAPDEKEELMEFNEFCDLVRMTVIKAWVRMVQELYLPASDMILLSYQEHMSVFALVVQLHIRTLTHLSEIILYVKNELRRALSEPGTPIGPIISEDFCAPVSQMTLKSFHYGGQASQLAGGLDRIEELLTLPPQIATPSMRLYPKDPNLKFDQFIQLRLCDVVDGFLEHSFLESVSSTNMDFDEKDTTRRIICCLVLKTDVLMQREISPNDVLRHVQEHPLMDELVQVTCSSLFDEKWWVCLSIGIRSGVFIQDKKKRDEPLKKSNAELCLYLYHKIVLLDTQRLLAGVLHITDYSEQLEDINVSRPDGTLEKRRYRVFETRGSNLYAFSADPKIACFFHVPLTKSNDVINEVYKTYGIDAACKAIEDELAKIMLSSDARLVARTHIRVIAAFMCMTGQVCSITFSGLTAAGANKLKMCTYERILKGFEDVATSAHHNLLDGTSESIMMGKQFSIGTGSVHLRPQNIETHVPQPDLLPLRSVSLPSQQVQTMEFNAAPFQEYIQKGAKEFVPLPPIKKQPPKIKKLKPPPAPRIPVAPKRVRAASKKKEKPHLKKVVVVKPPKQPRQKKKQKMQLNMEEAPITWHYDPVFLPSKSPPHT